MNFFKALFGGSEATPEEEQRAKEDRHFDLLKYDGVKAARMRQFDYAVKCYEKALELREDLEVHEFLAQAQLSRGDVEAALEQYEHIVQVQPDNVQLLVQTAHVCYMIEHYDRMAELCEQALALDANQGQAHYLRAQAFLGKGDAVSAIARLTVAISLKADDADAYLLRGQTLLRMGDAASASADVNQLMQLAPNNEDVLLLKARVEVAKGNMKDAVAAYGQVIDANPFHVEAYHERGKLRMQLGDSDGAKEDAAKVMELAPALMADVNGDYSAEGIEQKVKQAYSNLNPFGI